VACAHHALDSQLVIDGHEIGPHRMRNLAAIE